MSRNIFYVSNTQSELFPYNTRSQFNQYVDVHNLDYIKQDDIEVAIKSIAFDNAQSINILPTIEKPHILIVQDISEGDLYKQYMRTMLNILFLTSPDETYYTAAAPWMAVLNHTDKL